MIDRRTFVETLLMGGVATLHAARSHSELGNASRPAEILIVRHAEETNGTHLDKQGKRRAELLPTLFPARFKKPTMLYAAKSNNNTVRCVETIEPLAAALHLRIDQTYAEPKYAELAKAILTGQSADARVLICWRHETITQLAAALGVANPPAWPSKQYDHIWRITFPQKDGAELVDEPQRLQVT